MMKKIFLTAAILLSTLTPSFAGEQFFAWGAGQWDVKGFRGDATSSPHCGAVTTWDDGSYLTIIKNKNTGELWAAMVNNAWNIGDPAGKFSNYVSQFNFISSSGRMTSGTIAYELVDNRTVYFHGLTDRFVIDWINYREWQIVMPGTIGNVRVGLKGTARVADAFVACIQQL